MRNPFTLTIIVLALPAFAAGKGDITFTPEELQSFAPLPPAYERKDEPLTDAKIELGRMLYFETRLSKNHDVSCNGCHDLTKFGVDGRQFSKGHKGQLGGRNAPTVYNAGDHIAQFWDGRAADLEEQASGPVVNPVEMASDAARVEQTLSSIPEYVELFKKAFPDDPKPVTLANAAKAIAAFERKLVTPGRFDKFLAGDANALTRAEKQGLKKFLELGCPTCHNGAAVGGTSFQKLGLVEPYPDLKDEGRFAVTKNEEDKFKFRVPSLRNVARTGPWFHDGSKKTLEDVVKTMARHQLGKKVSDAEAKEVAAFLNALTGELPKDYIRPPKLPKSTPTTPKPDPS